MLRGEYVARQCGFWLCASAACIQTVFDHFLLLDDGEKSNFTAGDEVKVFELGPLPRSGATLRAGVMICYEAIIPRWTRKLVGKRDPNVLINITNDAWFGTSSAPMQHFTMAVLRAVENGVPIIRAANTGISGYISAMGEISGMTPLFERTTTSQEIKPGSGLLTIYATYGDVFAYLCCVVALIGVLQGRRS